MLRFYRDYSLVIQVGTIKYYIEPPINISFDGVMSVNGNLNRISIDIYNLNENKRRTIMKDPEEDVYMPLTFRVGYAGQLVRKFKGSIQEASTKRNGVNFVTTITCIDGGYDTQFGHVSASSNGLYQAIKDMMGTLKKTNAGTVNVTSNTTRPIVMVGNTVEILKKHLSPNEHMFFKNEKLYVIKKGDTIEYSVPVVSPETGLKDTPERKKNIVSFSTVMNPNITIGGKIDLQSTTAKHLNGIYKVETNSFKGEYMGSEWVDLFECVAVKNVTRVEDEEKKDEKNPIESDDKETNKENTDNQNINTDGKDSNGGVSKDKKKK